MAFLTQVTLAQVTHSTFLQIRLFLFSTEVTSDRDRKMAGKATKGLEGDWQFVSEKVKIPRRNTSPTVVEGE